jgi:hypothetical protein
MRLRFVAESALPRGQTTHHFLGIKNNWQLLVGNTIGIMVRLWLTVMHQ